MTEQVEKLSSWAFGNFADHAGTVAILKYRLDTENAMDAKQRAILESSLKTNEVLCLRYAAIVKVLMTDDGPYWEQFIEDSEFREAEVEKLVVAMLAMMEAERKSATN